MSKITTVIFDMYGTLVSNAQESWLSLFKEICDAHDLRIDHVLLYKEWKSHEVLFRETRLNRDDPNNNPEFKTYEEAWTACFRTSFANLRLDCDPSKAAKSAIYSMSLRDPYRDVSSTLPIIQGQWTTALLSNADDSYLRPLISRLGLKFRQVLSSENVRAYKPHPAPFQKILENLKVLPEESIYVGNSLFDDVMGAHGVGMKTAWINRTNEEFDENMIAPDCTITNLIELPHILERWQ